MFDSLLPQTLRLKQCWGILVCVWLLEFARGCNIGLCCSDVSGAFDRVSLERLVGKLEKKGLIQSSWKIAESGRKRKYYRISSEGGKELKIEKQNWNTMNQIITKIWKIEPSLV